MKEKIFYYHFKRLNAWLIFNLILTGLIVSCLFCHRVWFYTQMYVIVGVVIFSWLVWIYKYVLPQKMAVVTDESITIDHNAPLKWRDIAAAEIREIYCCLQKRKILVLLPKEGIDYQYNWLQKHNAGFTAFSIPLYGILTPEDERELTEIVTDKIGLRKR